VYAVKSSKVRKKKGEVAVDYRPQDKREGDGGRQRNCLKRRKCGGEEVGRFSFNELSSESDGAQKN